MISNCNLSHRLRAQVSNRNPNGGGVKEIRRETWENTNKYSQTGGMFMVTNCLEIKKILLNFVQNGVILNARLLVHEFSV